MSEQYLIYGAELSPYSVKIRAYFRYKEIPHKWIIRDQKSNVEYKKFAKLPIVPLVVTPEKTGLQDSTPIIKLLEHEYQNNSVSPPEAHTAFVARILEEYADEWLNKAMFHYRWRYEDDQISASKRFVGLMIPVWANKIPLLNRVLKRKFAATIRKRMISRLWVVGSNTNTESQIEQSLNIFLHLSEQHLQDRPYFFGFRPSIADFGIWGQVYNMWTDPTVGQVIESSHPETLKWIKRMLHPKPEGEFEPWESLEATLMPILKKELADVFMPWLEANNKALATGEKELSLKIKGKDFTHSVGSPQKYHAKSFAMLLEEYNDIPDKTKLDAVLQEAGLISYFK
ncbi:MAG: glutathione S-transferase family protein [Nitrospinales bacterium]|nr:glutathione S-transferase family protein [Nitrospinales bacterium]